MKKKVAAVFALLMAFGMTGGMYAKAGVKGDVNNDGALTVKDLTKISKYLLGKKDLEAEELSAADINGDGNVNIIDFILEKELLITESGGVEYIAGAPEFSVESGFYENEISLALSAGTGATIYYTTDGTEPTTDSEIYSSEISIKNRTSEPNKYASITEISLDNINVPNVTKGTVVKAFAVDKDGNKSETVSHSYFIGIDINSQYGGMPVLSITADPDDLFSYENGIYVTGKVYDEWRQSGDNSLGMQTYFYPCNYNQKGQEWERKVFIELFENDGALAYSQPIGARITGNATRASVVKSMKFYSRDEYGKKNVKYELIPDAKMEIDDITVRDKYKRFTMRNGGNDLGHAQFRDNYIQSLLGDRAFETQSSRPAVMFINGEYWGIYTLQEDYSDSYIENNYNINKDNVVIIKCGGVDDGNDEDIALYDELINFAKNNDLSVTSNYDRIDQMMDMQSFIDYQCAEIFIANQDWMNNNNNYRVWRARTVSDQPYEDGKWRWMLYDTEFSLSLYKGYMGGTYGEDSLKIAMYGKTSNSGFGDWGGFFPGMGNWGGPGQQPGQQPGQPEQLEPEEHTVLFYKLLQNDEFKRRFVTTFSDLMNKNLSQENMLSELDRFTKIYEPVIQEHMARLGGSNNFNTEINDIKTFIQNREKNIYSFFRTDLELSGETAQLNLAVNDSNAGTIQVNTITATGSQWSGTYCTDYPVTLTAIPAEGYTFTGWSGGADGNSATITVTPGRAETITAQFSKN